MRNKIIYLFIFGSLFLFTLSDSIEKRDTCPNNCSNHGSCNPQGICNCQPGYSGTDCSIPTTTMISGRTYPGTVSIFEWSFYEIIVQYRGGGLNIYLNQTSQQGDCDIYVQINALPTRSSYYARDITTSKNVKMSLLNIAAGTWNIGVYGFSACSFVIMSQITGSCPNDCSGHGTCVNGVCTCNSGYSGNDCSISTINLPLNSAMLGSVSTLEMQAYRIQIISGNFLGITLNQIGGGDCDLYVRFNEVPSVWNWDYANVTLNSISTIMISDARIGYYYAGVYGFQSCNYSIVATTSNQCPNKCSNRGTCSSLTCSCPLKYSGDYCQTRNAPLNPDEVDTGYVEYNSWNYFTYRSNSDNNLVVYINQTEAGDCDLYVRAGSNPTRFLYDFQDIGTKQFFSLSINDPGNTDWHIGIYGWSKCSYSIWVDEISSCPENCNNNGVCTNGVCVCNSGYSGDSCNSQSSLLSSGQALTNQATSYNTWAYYSINVANTSSLHIIVRETSSSGLLWVYVGKTVPTLRSYLSSDTSNSNTHIITFTFDFDVSDTFQIGVYGNPYSQEESSVPFTIVAWFPNY